MRSSEEIEKDIRENEKQQKALKTIRARLQKGWMEAEKAETTARIKAELKR